MKIYRFNDTERQYISATGNAKLWKMLRKHYGFKTYEQLYAFIEERTSLFTVEDVLDPQEVAYHVYEDGKLDMSQIIHSDASVKETFDGIVDFMIG